MLYFVSYCDKSKQAENFKLDDFDNTFIYVMVKIFKNTNILLFFVIVNLNM